MKALPRLLIVGLSALLSVACQPSTTTTEEVAAPTAVSKAAADRFLIEPAVASDLNYRIDWLTNLKLEEGARFKYIVTQPDVLILLESKNILTVVDTLTGAVKMREQVATPITKLFMPSRQDRTVIINSESHVYVFNMDNGALLKRYPLPTVASTGALLVGDLSVFGSPTGKVFAINMRDGFPDWEYQMRGALLVSPVLVEGSTIVAADSLGVVKALSPRGKLLWAKSAPPWRRISADIQPGISAVYIASEDQGLYGFDRTTGRMWRYLARRPLTQSPVVVGERVFQYVPESGLLCFDAVTGQRLWASDATVMPMMIRGDYLYARTGPQGQNGRDIVLLEETTGKPVETIKLPKAHRIVADDTIDGNLYLFNYDGRVLKLSPKK